MIIGLALIYLTSSFHAQFLHAQFIENDIIWIYCRAENGYIYTLFDVSERKVVYSYRTKFVQRYFVGGSHKNLIAHPEGLVVASGKKINTPNEFMIHTRSGDQKGVDEVIFVYNNYIYERTSNTVVGDEIIDFKINVWELKNNKLIRKSSSVINNLWPGGMKVINLNDQYHLSIEPDIKMITNGKIQDFSLFRVVDVDSFKQIDEVSFKGRYLTSCVTKDGARILCKVNDELIKYNLSVIDNNIILKYMHLPLVNVCKKDYFICNDFLYSITEINNMLFEINYIYFDNFTESLLLKEYSVPVPVINKNCTLILLIKDNLLRIYERKNLQFEEKFSLPLLKLL